MLAMGFVLAVAPTGSARAADPLPPLVTTLQTVADGAADVLNTATAAVSDNPRADITGASLEYAPGWIRMKVQVKQPTDPLKDQAWSDRSDAEWALDTNADGKPEYTAEFATADGELYGAVFDVNKPDEKSLCDADSAGFTPEDGYTLVIDPKCIGNPKSLGYSVAIFFDTNPKDDKAPMATDRVPDQGFKEVAAPVQPGEAPPPSAPAAGKPTAPAQAPPVAGGAPGAAAKPGATAPAPRTAASAGAPAAPAGSANQAPSGAPAPAGAAQAPKDPLARTGSASTTRALLGFGVMLVGAGLLVMTRPARRLGSLA
jgi:hypothetical protein